MATPFDTTDAPGGPWQHAYVRTPSGSRVHFVTAGPADALPVVLVHGWPDLWFGWRRQIKALSPKYRLIVPDLRGFGESSNPTDVASYGGKNVTSDLAALLDALDIEKAVFIGHDWGGAVVWRMCLYYPARVLAVCGVCTPYTPPHKHYLDMDTVIKFIPAFEYQKFLADTADAASYLDTSPRRFFTALFRRFNESAPKEQRPAAFSDTLRGVKDSPHWVYTQKSTLLSDDELEYYVQQYTKSGFQSNCNYYATRKLDFDTELGMPTQLNLPALYIGADKDAILSPEMARKMPQHIPNLEMKVVKNAGHWVLWEQTEQVNTILSEWLAKIDTKYGASAKRNARL